MRYAATLPILFLLLAPAGPAGAQASAAGTPADLPAAVESEPERDPFGVTPELRQRSGQRQRLPGAHLQPGITGRLPDMTLKAIVTGSRAYALISIDQSAGGRGRGAVRSRTVMLREGELLTLEDGTLIRVNSIGSDVVSLQTGTDPSNEFLLR
ncbi:hypothetical protein [Pseudothauera rhizosphaerae]|uniref:Uncharacterized protein n=1 Tax=Pseudothauera rhizosphaerae TaxID=2565932 RepID=A0A4S4AS53_9RHOO|nr:hypothetical protein [Pseudothauera rhizosphaerae]THF62681.1 hypothetical protein E6O51_06905 [Pseudothauera rhizosphaerae]